MPASTASSSCQSRVDRARLVFFRGSPTLAGYFASETVARLQEKGAEILFLPSGAAVEPDEADLQDVADVLCPSEPEDPSCHRWSFRRMEAPSPWLQGDEKTAIGGGGRSAAAATDGGSCAGIGIGVGMGTETGEAAAASSSIKPSADKAIAIKRCLVYCKDYSEDELSAAIGCSSDHHQHQEDASFHRGYSVSTFITAFPELVDAEQLLWCSELSSGLLVETGVISSEAKAACLAETTTTTKAAP